MFGTNTRWRKKDLEDFEVESVNDLDSKNTKIKQIEKLLKR